MKKKYIIAFSMLIMLCSSALFANASETKEPRYINTKTMCEYSEVSMPDTTSGSIAVYNVESGLAIYEKNTAKKVYPASTVKIMTAIIAYESIPDLSVQITVSRDVRNKSVGSKLGLEIGDIYTAEDLLKAVLICGSNDAANQLAEYVTGGNDEQFVTMMNEKAKSLGCTSTNFTNVTGLHDGAMYTTASDMMKIAMYAYELGEIAEWSTLASYYFTPINDPDSPKLRYNRNYFVARNVVTDYYYRNSRGLSAGSTPQAGNCLITSASNNGCTYICVIMDSPVIENDDTNYTYVDASLLLNKCFRSFEFKSVTDPMSIIEEVELKLCADSNHISLYPKDSISHLLPTDVDFSTEISVEKVINTTVYDAPVVAGEEFGDLIIRYKGDYILGKTRLISNESFERSDMLYFIDNVTNFVTSSFFIVTVSAAVILFTAYAVISIRMKNRSRMFRRRR